MHRLRRGAHWAFVCDRFASSLPSTKASYLLMTPDTISFSQAMTPFTPPPLRQPILNSYALMLLSTI
ncbi:hypothetical protein BDW62DRAFT_25497 [Aspergillus aurantiobrunneus]